MAKTSMKLKQQRKQKFSTREYNRCRICGRPHAYLRKYGICRICFRELAYKGEIPGVILIFLPAILIPACVSSSLAFCMIISAFKFNKQCD